MELIEHKIHHLFTKNKLTLSIAESCTGGGIAARLTLLPGCSNYFLGSLVAYSNTLKIKLLGIDSELLKEKGAVSEEVVIKMAESIRLLTNSDYSLAVSGIAGPAGGTLEKPVGTIWAAISTVGKTFSWQLQLKGTRKEIIEQAIDLTLERLFEVVNEQS